MTNSFFVARVLRILYPIQMEEGFEIVSRNSRCLCASWNLADCAVSKICSKTSPSDNIFDNLTTGYHGNCQEEASCPGLQGHFDFFPRFIVTHAYLLTFSCPSSFWVCSRSSQGTGSPFFCSPLSHTVVKRGFYHIQPSVCSDVWRERDLLLRATWVLRGLND